MCLRDWVLRFWVEGLGFRVQGSQFGNQGLGFRVCACGFGVGIDSSNLHR